MNIKSLSHAALFCAASAIPFQALQAQAPAQPDDEDVAPDDNQIIVTAQLIEQRALDVPITISALTGDAIAELGVTDLDELSNYIPGLNIQEQSANNPGIVIRGITSDSGSAQQGPRVTLYYNGVDISRSRGSYQAIYDLDRVEVIKGPQATLFGTASAVGAISLVSARPRAGYSSEVTGGYGNFDQTLVSGFVNAGSDVVAGRIAFEWRTRDGYVENLAPSQEEDLYAQDQFGARGSLRFTPNDRLTVDLIGTFDRQRHGGTPFISDTFATPDGPADPFGRAFLGGSPYSEAALGNSQLGLDREVYDANLTAEYLIGDSLTFTTVNGYREFDSHEVFDADGGPAPFLEFAEIAKGHQVSHEGRFTYVDPRWRAAFGWNFFTEDNLQRVPFSTEEGTFLQCLTTSLGLAPVIPGIPCVAADGSVPAAQVTQLATGGAATAIPYSSVFENQGNNQSYSLFADATFIPTTSLELTAGARLLIEQRRSGFVTSVPNSVLTGAPLIPGQIDTGGRTFEAEDSFSAVLPRFNALYRITPDLNVFATVSKGRRSPVVSLGARRAGTEVLPNINVIPQEVVWNYEGGIKFGSRTVSGSLGLYYQDYSNFQTTRTISDPNDPSGLPLGTTVTESVGSASNLGVEAEINIRPTSWLSVFANVGYIDGGIDDDPINGTVAGDRFRLQPEWQAAGGFTVDYPVAPGVRIFATPSVTHRSRIFFEVPNSLRISQEAVTLLNARAGISFADERFEVAGFIRNATNERYLLDAGNTGGAFGRPTFIPAEPRFYGVQLTARIGR